MTCRVQVAGVFVGGESRRMAGRPKGLLVHPDGRTLVQRALELVRPLAQQVVLVGGRPAYGHLGVPVLDDAAQGVGPLGGLVSLLQHAGKGRVLVLACDMPFVPRQLLERLLSQDTSTAVICPARDTGIEPLCAVYEASAVLGRALEALQQGRYSLRALVRSCDSVQLALQPGEWHWVDDWDCPEDVRAGWEGR